MATTPIFEKRTQQLPPIRVSESLETALFRLAGRYDRTMSEYIRMILERHCFGHGISVHRREEDGNENRADQCYAEESGNP